MTKKRDLPLYMTAAEVVTVSKYAERHTGRLPTMYARLVCLIMWRAGLRIAEALELKYSDLNLADTPPTLRVRLGKGKRTRIVPLHAELAHELATAKAYRPKHKGQIVSASASTVHRWIKDGAQAAALAGELDQDKAAAISPHTFRHSAARHWLANSVKINAVQLWLGHKDLTTTMIYLELVPDPELAMSEVP